MRPAAQGTLELILYSILAGSVGIFVRLTEGLDAWTIIFFRGSIAVIFIGTVVLLRGRLRELALKHPLRTVGVGLLQGASIFLYFQAILHTSVTNAVFLLYTAPIFAVPLSVIFLDKKIHLTTWIGIATTLLGILLILDPRTFSFTAGETVGNLMGLGAGFFYAAMSIAAKPLSEKRSGYYTAFWAYAIIALLFAFALGHAQTDTVLRNGWWLLGIGVLSTGIAFILFFSGVKKVPGQSVFIITALEPLTGVVLAALVLNELPKSIAYLGAIFILLGVYVATPRPATITPAA